jgi:hypothetical protein
METSRMKHTPTPIVALLTAALRAGITRDELLAAFESTVAFNGAMPDILQKYYTFDEPAGRLGSIYLWRSRDAAQAFFAPGWDERFTAKWGTRPSVSFVEALVVLRPMSSATANDQAPASAAV